MIATLWKGRRREKEREKEKEKEGLSNIQHPPLVILGHSVGSFLNLSVRLPLYWFARCLSLTSGTGNKRTIGRACAALFPSIPYDQAYTRRNAKSSAGMMDWMRWYTAIKRTQLRCVFACMCVLVPVSAYLSLLFKIDHYLHPWRHHSLFIVGPLCPKVCDTSRRFSSTERGTNMFNSASQSRN